MFTLSTASNTAAYTLLPTSQRRFSLTSVLWSTCGGYSTTGLTPWKLTWKLFLTSFYFELGHHPPGSWTKLSLFLVFNNSSAKFLMPAARNTIYGQNYWSKKSLNLWIQVSSVPLSRFVKSNIYSWSLPAPTSLKWQATWRVYCPVTQ